MKFLLIISLLFLCLGIAFGSHYSQVNLYGSKSSIVHEQLINLPGGDQNLDNEDENATLDPLMLQILLTSNISSPTSNVTTATDGDFWEQGMRDFEPNAHSFSNSHAQGRYDYIYGGVLDNGTYSDNFFRYDKLHRFWETLSPNVTNGQQPGPLAYHCSVVDGNRLVLTGGKTSNETSGDTYNDAVYHIDLTNLDGGWTRVNHTDFVGSNQEFFERAGHWCYFGDSEDNENVIYIGEGFIGNETYPEYQNSIITFYLSDLNGELTTPTIEHTQFLFQEGCDVDNSPCTNSYPQYHSGDTPYIKFGHWGFDFDFTYNRETEQTFFVISGGFNIDTFHVNGTFKINPITNNTFFKWTDTVRTNQSPVYHSGYDDGSGNDLGDGSFVIPPDDFNLRAQHIAFEYNFQIFISGGRYFSDLTGFEMIFPPYCDFWYFDGVSYPTAPYTHIPDVLDLHTDYGDPANPKFVRWPMGYIDGVRQDIGAYGTSFTASSYATAFPMTGQNVGYHSFESLDIVGKQLAYKDYFGLNSGKFFTVFEDDHRNSKREQDVFPNQGQSFNYHNPNIFKLADDKFAPGEYMFIVKIIGSHNVLTTYSAESDECAYATYVGTGTDRETKNFARQCLADGEDIMSFYMYDLFKDEGIKIATKDTKDNSKRSECYICECLSGILDGPKREVVQSKLASVSEVSKSEVVDEVLVDERSCALTGPLATIQPNTCVNSHISSSYTISSIAKGEGNLYFLFAPLGGASKDIEKGWFTVCPVEEEVITVDDFSEDIVYALIKADQETPSLRYWYHNYYYGGKREVEEKDYPSECYFGRNNYFAALELLNRELTPQCEYIYLLAIATDSVEGSRFYVNTETEELLGCEHPRDEEGNEIVENVEEYVCLSGLPPHAKALRTFWEYCGDLKREFMNDEKTEALFSGFYRSLPYGHIGPSVVTEYIENFVGYKVNAVGQCGEVENGAPVYVGYDYCPVWPNIAFQYPLGWKKRYDFASMYHEIAMFGYDLGFDFQESIDRYSEIIDIASSGGACFPKKSLPFAYYGCPVVPVTTCIEFETPK